MADRQISPSQEGSGLRRRRNLGRLVLGPSKCATYMQPKYAEPSSAGHTILKTLGYPQHNLSRPLPRGEGVRPHSTPCSPAALMTGVISAISSLRKAANAAGVSVLTSTASLASVAATSGDFRLSLMTALSLATMPAGMPARPTTPVN